MRRRPRPAKSKEAKPPARKSPKDDGAPKDGSAWALGDPDYRVARGGSWRNDASFLRAAAREKRNINVKFDTLGFRVARTLSF